MTAGSVILKSTDFEDVMLVGLLAISACSEVRMERWVAGKVGDFSPMDTACCLLDQRTGAA